MEERRRACFTAQGGGKHHCRLIHRARPRLVDDKDIPSLHRTTGERAPRKGLIAMGTERAEARPGELRCGARIIDETDEPLAFPLDHPREGRQGDVQRQGIALHGCQIPCQLRVVQDGRSLPCRIRRKQVVRHEHAAVNRRDPCGGAVLHLMKPDRRAQCPSIRTQLRAQECKKHEVSVARGLRPVAVDLELPPSGAIRSPHAGDSLEKGPGGVRGLKSSPEKGFVGHIHDGDQLSFPSRRPRLSLRGRRGESRRPFSRGFHFKYPHVEPVCPRPVCQSDLILRGALLRFPVVEGAMGGRSAGKKGEERKPKEGAPQERTGCPQEQHGAKIPASTSTCRGADN